MEYSLQAEIGGKTVTIQTGKVAKQASGAAVVSCEDTTVLVTVVGTNEERPGIDFLPLSVEYQEKIYAAGRIPGNYQRREVGRPSEKETLTARLIDRPIRPLFPKGWGSEIQVMATVLSMDRENEPDVLAMLGASTALTLSDIPFEGPVAAVRVGRIDGEYRINPRISGWDKSDISVIVAGSRTGVVMVEGGGNEISEDEMLEAIFAGHKALQPLIDLQEELHRLAGKPKRFFPAPVVDAELKALLEREAPRIRETVLTPGKVARNAAMRELKANIVASLGETYADRRSEVSDILHSVQKHVCRDLVLKEGRRIDGRAFDEIRPISCEVANLPRPHGSALFTRGETQVLGILTLGSGQDEQRVETLQGDEFKRFMLHYNFPPYSVGETKRPGGPSRRDIGHGALATRALEKVLPPPDKFDYTIRLVAEVLESNGSSSMGTVCSGTLALMDGGVPITAPVSGIAMGLVKEGDQVVVLSDILGDEDHTGDMDFKVAGTARGVTAFQMDIKILELSREIMAKALAQAREGRLHILNRMLETLDQPRIEMSPYAPKILSIQIPPDKIREVIGPGGKVIRAIQAETNTKIDIEDSGMVKIAACSSEDGEAAMARVLGITSDPEVGAVYEGKVVKTTDFGAFVNILPGKDGLVHISQLSTQRVKKVTDVVKEGDTLRVKIIEISRDGKIKLSHKAILEENDGEK